MTEHQTTTVPAVRSESRGPHWVAWVPDENGKPLKSVILVGQTREEAEARARSWAAAALDT
jgi:predicted RNase H-like HicB family nuclease